MEMELSMMGRGRDAIDMIIDADSMQENLIEDYIFASDMGPGAVVGTAKISGEKVTIIASDAMEMNMKFRVVYSGVIGLEEGYKMAMAVYRTIASDKNKPVEEKRPIVLIVDTPGNAPGKLEEIVGMNKATGAYQLALAEARKEGHPIVAMVIGRAISGAFLCHGLQADRILSLSKNFGTMIHVMPLTSVSRITKIDIERLEELSKENPVFAAGPEFFYQLGGVEEMVYKVEDMRKTISKHISEIHKLKENGQFDQLGPWGRGELGFERNGRKARKLAIQKMEEEYLQVIDRYI